MFLTRSNFIKHWEQKHLSSLVAMTTFSGTRLNSRIYQGYALYLLALHADYSQDDTAECLSPSTSPEGLHEAANNSVRKAWSGRISLDDRKEEGVGVRSQEQMEQIIRQGMLTVVDPGDGLDSI